MRAAGLLLIDDVFNKISYFYVYNYSNEREKKNTIRNKNFLDDSITIYIRYGK